MSTATTTCGCSRTPEESGIRVTVRCEEAERLWEELIEARDAVWKGQRETQRKGHKPRLNEFAKRREAYHDHIRAVV